MKKISKVVSVLMVLVMMFSLLTFNSAAASIKKIEILSLPTKTTFVQGPDWNYGYWKFPEGDGLGEFTPLDGVITFMYNGGYFTHYMDRGMIDMNGLVVRVTYSDGSTKDIAYKETKYDTGVIQQNILASPQGGEYKLGENVIEIYFESNIYVYTTYKINIVEAGAAVTQKGDVNADSKINSSDALMALQHSVGTLTLNAEQKALADMNSDNKINSLDALLILQKSVEG